MFFFMECRFPLVAGLTPILVAKQPAPLLARGFSHKQVIGQYLKARAFFCETGDRISMMGILLYPSSSFYWEVLFTTGKMRRVGHGTCNLGKALG